MKSRLIAGFLCYGLCAAAGPALSQQPATKIDFLGAYCTANDAKGAASAGFQDLKLSFSAFTLSYDPALAGAHTAHCKVLVQTGAGQLGFATAIKSADITLAAATGEAFSAELSMMSFDTQKLSKSAPKLIASTSLPATVTLTLDQAPTATFCDSPADQLIELNFALIAIENGERALGTMAITGIDNFVTETVPCTLREVAR